MDNDVLKLSNICKEYTLKYEKVIALKNVTLNFKKGKFYAIMGHSGSGKSTLIRIMGLLENITSGDYMINGKKTTELSSNEEAKLRKDFIGLIFQNFFLDKYLKAYENVIFPMLINKNIPKEQRKEYAIKLLEKLDLGDRVNHFPKELSGGEQQRVAIARALANNPDIILADEPTGNLDEENEKKIFEILKKFSKDGKCVIVVSHSSEVKNYADIVYEINKGMLVK